LASEQYIAEEGFIVLPSVGFDSEWGSANFFVGCHSFLSVISSSEKDFHRPAFQPADHR
jgi:hypothetical protein